MKCLAKIAVILVLAINVLHGRGIAQGGCPNFGDPIINITFGNAGNPVFNLDPDVIPGYTFSPGNANTPGTYTIASSGRNGGSIYFSNLLDHTPDDVEGGMLLVNANEQPGIFYTEVQDDLCPDTEFTFSAWVVNASPPTLRCHPELDIPVEPINVLFEIRTLSGELLAEYRTGEIHSTATPQWVRDSVSFNTGQHTAVRLIIQNIGTGGCGNNIGIDDIQFRPCGPEIELTTNLTSHADTVFLCVDANEVTITGEIGAGYNNPVLQWQRRGDEETTWLDIDGENGLELRAQPAQNTWYRLAAAANTASLNNPSCRVVSHPIRAARAEVPSVNVSVQTYGTCLGDTVEFNPGEFHSSDAGPLRYQWYWQDGADWKTIDGADGRTLTPSVDEVGIFSYQRRAVNICEIEFVVNEYELEVLPILEATLALEQNLVCVDEEGVALVGGSIVGVEDVRGVYGGPGVEDGVFYPTRAGVGEHALTYSSPPGSLCYIVDTAVMRVVDTVSLDPLEDKVILPGRSVRLTPNTNATEFKWDAAPGLDQYTIREPIASPTESTTYWITVRNGAGCEKRDSVRVMVLAGLVLPNSFTPNGDGANDRWEIEGLDQYPNAQVQVFNRWGVLVFSSKGYTMPWDGQSRGMALPAATYYYRITSDVLTEPLSGAITILR